jgi:hypothetical protein
MLKWFQVFVDKSDREESVPMRFMPEHIYGFEKLNASQTIIYTKLGPYTVCEPYEKFSARLFAFANFVGSESDDDADEVVTTKRKIVVRAKHPKTLSLDELEKMSSYYDDHQPDSNC